MCFFSTSKEDFEEKAVILQQNEGRGYRYKAISH